MKYCLALIFAACVLCMASLGFAQTAEYHLQMGVQPNLSTPPEIIDMSSVTDGPFGPAAGKQLQVFILIGEGMVHGVGKSSDLSRNIRRGFAHVLMFYEDRWQPLRPVGLHFGPEIGFALGAAVALPGETIGIVMPRVDDTTDSIAKASRAIHVVPSRIVALVKVGGVSGDGAFTPAIARTRLGAPTMNVVESSGVLSVNPGETGTEWELRHGQGLARMAVGSH